MAETSVVGGEEEVAVELEADCAIVTFAEQPRDSQMTERAAKSYRSVDCYANEN